MKALRTVVLFVAGLLPALVLAQTTTYSFMASDLGFMYGRSTTTAMTNTDGSYSLTMGSNTEFLVGYLPPAIVKASWLSTEGNSISLSLSWTENPNTDLAQSGMRVGFFDCRGTPIVAGTTGRHAGDTNPAATDDFGYWWNLSGAGSTSASFYGRNTAPASGNLMGTTMSPTIGIGGVVDTTCDTYYATWSSGVTYTWSIKYTKLSSGIAITGTLTGTDGTNFVVNSSDPGIVSSAAVTTASKNMATLSEVGLRWAAGSNIPTVTILGGTIQYVAATAFVANTASCLGLLAFGLLGWRRFRPRR